MDVGDCVGACVGEDVAWLGWQPVNKITQIKSKSKKNTRLLSFTIED